MPVRKQHLPFGASRHSFSGGCQRQRLRLQLLAGSSLDRRRLAPECWRVDVAFHGNWAFANLCEGNIVKYIYLENDFGDHGVNGPFNTFVRNRVESNDHSLSCSQTQSVPMRMSWANEVRAGSISLQGFRQLLLWKHAELRRLTCRYDQPHGLFLLPDHDPSILPSLPVYWNIPSPCPSIGYPLALSDVKTNPAFARYVSGTPNLTVGPPSLAKQPTNFVVNAGSTAAFSVQAAGTPVAIFQWFKNGVAVPGQNQRHLHHRQCPAVG